MIQNFVKEHKEKVQKISNGKNYYNSRTYDDDKA